MKKNIKVLFLILVIITLTACKSNKVNIADHISPLIIKYHYNNNVDTSKLSRKEKKLFDKFIESQKITNKVINISEEVIFPEESFDARENTKGIYKDGNNYYIKFRDLVWESYEDDYKSSIVLDNKGTLIFRSLFPVLYDETKDNIIYKYRFYNKVIYEDHMDYHYKSLGDKSGLIIRYHLDKDNDIKDILLLYQELFYYPGQNTKKEKNVADKALLFTVIGIAIIAAVVFVFIKLTH